MKRPSDIAVASLLAALVVIGTGAAGHIQAGLSSPDDVLGTLGGVVAPWTAAVVLCAVTVAIHAFVARAVFIEYLDCNLSRRRLVVGMLALVLAHAAEIHIFGLGLYAYASAMDESLGGLAEERLIDYLYFSYVSYTSLGLGDIYPEGSLRLIVGIEALTGLLMIGWSASMTVVLFRREWFT